MHYEPNEGDYNRPARIRVALCRYGERWLDHDPVEFVISGVHPASKGDGLYVILLRVNGDDGGDDPWMCALMAKDELDACARAVDKVKDVFGANNVRWQTGEEE